MRLSFFACLGWILLALCVALVNANNGLTALWVLLTCVGFILFLVYAVRPPFLWILRKNRALQDGPSQGIIALTLLICLASAFFTGIIGVHPIFGAFLAGLICPHEGGFAIKVAEKIEDIIGALFLPLYFTLSGLSTNIGLLDSGIVWGYVVAVCVVAFFSKFIGASIAARFTGMLWRECFAIGSLMSCKGLVELIVLVSNGDMVFYRCGANKRRTLASMPGSSALVLSPFSSSWPSLPPSSRPR